MRKPSYILLLMIAAFWILALTPQNKAVVSEGTSSTVQPKNAQSTPSGDEVCAGCHSAIYKSYKLTPMAHASGRATENLITADFTHKESGVHYRIFAEDGRAWLSFERKGDALVHGKRELLYYIGSGRRGLTYLFAVDGFVFESPINWYGDKRTWDMAPAYQNAQEIPMNLPAHTSCLHCHVSGMRPPLQGTENRYQMPLFPHSGVSCERCHGPGSSHINGGAIVNPAKLSPERRDAICMQCHMEGRVSVERAGRHIYEFKPGDSLTDYIRYYVFPESSSAALGAVSQVEALAQSACKKKSGDAMSCTSCHDPHFSPPPEERVSYYRSKCLACHGELETKHRPKEKDCIACHMPASQSTDVAHTEVTDHRILRMPVVPPPPLETSNDPKLRLVPFPDSPEADLRDLSLAWESLANRGMEEARPQAENMLRHALVKFPNDPAIFSALGYEEQKHGAINAARDHYRRALSLDPDSTDAATNLGVIEAQSGDLSDAIRLWQGAFQLTPGRSNIGMNLARAFCMSAKFNDSRDTIIRVLEFNPDLGGAKKSLQDLNRPHPTCNF
ncbi:MAG: multiheme c-type cytochrome [Terriglobales bacterium]